MKDTISISRVQLLHPAIRAEVQQLIERAETFVPAAIRIVQGLRTIAEQNIIYAQGRTKPGKIVTNAKGGSSFHNYGLAIDFALLYDRDGSGNYEAISWDTTKDIDKDGQADWMEVVRVFRNAGYEWGGDWKTLKDLPHLQKTFGYTWQHLFTKYKGGQLNDGYVIL